jgi:hypothetical protein
MFNLNKCHFIMLSEINVFFDAGERRMVRDIAPDQNPNHVVRTSRFLPCLLYNFRLLWHPCLLLELELCWSGAAAADITSSHAISNWVAAILDQFLQQREKKLLDCVILFPPSDQIQFFRSLTSPACFLCI